MRVFELKDILPLLRSEVKQAGGASAWARKTGVHRTTVTKVLLGLQPPTKSIIIALGLRVVFISKSAP
jgi:DNA-binding phage protein